jgi:hypothetical protein
MKVPLLYEFEHLAGAAVDGTASPAQLARFNAILREAPELAQLYFQQARMHAALLLRGEGKFLEASLPSCPGRTKISALQKIIRPFSPHPHRVRRTLPWLIKGGIAALLLLGVGTVLWQVARYQREAEIVQNTGDVTLPVTLVSGKDICGLVTPETLPGVLSLQGGSAKFRLASGTEFTVVGQTEIDIRSGMEVALIKGRLLTFVPPRATGFTLRMARLTVWDIGTIFAASSEPREDAVLVFKGSVQVLDARGDGIQLCEQGEGVRVTGTASPVPLAFARDKDFKKYSGMTALAEPVSTLKRMSALLGQSHIEQQILAEGVKPLPFSKTPWVRPSASLQQEEDKMNRASAAAVLSAATMILGAGGAGAVSEPTQIFFAPQMNRLWTTVFTNEVLLRWTWATNATRAQLDIVGMNRTFTWDFNGVTSNSLWTVFTGTSPAEEDTYDLTLTFYNASETVVNVLTSRLAIVKGAFGAVQVDPGPADTKWGKITDNAVIPYDADWTAATSGARTSQLVIAKEGGSTQTSMLPDASGYVGWKIKESGWGFGTFNLALTFPGTVEDGWTAVLTRNPGGTMIRVF